MPHGGLRKTGPGSILGLPACRYTRWRSHCASGAPHHLPAEPHRWRKPPAPPGPQWLGGVCTCGQGFLGMSADLTLSRMDWAGWPKVQPTS